MEYQGVWEIKPHPPQNILSEIDIYWRTIRFDPGRSWTLSDDPGRSLKILDNLRTIWDGLTRSGTISDDPEHHVRYISWGDLYRVNPFLWVIYSGMILCGVGNWTNNIIQSYFTPYSLTIYMHRSFIVHCNDEMKERPTLFLRIVNQKSYEQKQEKFFK